MLVGSCAGRSEGNSACELGLGACTVALRALTTFAADDTTRAPATDTAFEFWLGTGSLTTLLAVDALTPTSRLAGARWAATVSFTGTERLADVSGAERVTSVVGGRRQCGSGLWRDREIIRVWGGHFDTRRGGGVWAEGHGRLSRSSVEQLLAWLEPVLLQLAAVDAPLAPCAAVAAVHRKWRARLGVRLAAASARTARVLCGALVLELGVSGRVGGDRSASCCRARGRPPRRARCAEKATPTRRKWSREGVRSTPLSNEEDDDADDVMFDATNADVACLWGEEGGGVFERGVTLTLLTIGDFRVALRGVMTSCTAAGARTGRGRSWVSCVVGARRLFFLEETVWNSGSTLFCRTCSKSVKI